MEAEAFNFWNMYETDDLQETVKYYQKSQEQNGQDYQKFINEINEVLKAREVQVAR